MMALYSCTVELSQGASSAVEAKAEITADSVEITGGVRASIPFVDIMDMRLLNYHLHLVLRDCEVVLSKLGFQTEEFFEKLWLAYAAKSLDALFVEGKPIIACEGDYAYQEPGIEKASIGKLELREESLSIVPHDVGTRRVPFCFASAPVRDGFKLALELDTGERYQVSRLGNNTEPFFKKMTAYQKQTASAWQAAHAELERSLETRLGAALAQYREFTQLGVPVEVGLFAVDDDAFWFAAVGGNRAAVELVCDEQTATYLYRFSTGAEQFILSLRHAMEAVKRHRRLIYLTDEELEVEPLFRMAVDRSTHVRFLRTCNTGRIIHTSNWAGRLREFFA